MKTRNGKIIKLDANEKRVGNFVLRDDGGYVKIYDIGRKFILSVSKDRVAGDFLKQSFDNLTEDSVGRGISNYIGVAFLFANTVPDTQMLVEVAESCEKCIARHPELYGGSSAVDATDDAHIEGVKSVEEMKEFEREIEGVSKEGKE